ncbi:MAG: PAS domain S-box protein [Syntrophales bacterium]
MTVQETCPVQAADLRCRAEEFISESGDQFPENLDNYGDTLRQDLPTITPTITQTPRELRVHQIELEKQNSAPHLRKETNHTILLVDDEPNVLSALTRVLRNSPYQLLTASSGNQALAIMETTTIKVIVSDEQMVGMQGSELLAEVQRRFPNTVRLMLTGHGTLEASMRAMNEGQVYRFLIKPWDEGMLRLSLSAAIEKYDSDAEKRRLQDALRESEERYRTVVELSPESVIVHRELKIIYANPAAIKMLGATSLQELAGSSYLDRIHPDHHEAILARVKKALSEGVCVPVIKLKYLKLDGTIIDCETVGTPILYDSLPAIHAAIHDITVQKKVEKLLAEHEALRLANAYNRTMIEVSLDPLMTIGPDGKITDVNTATEHATGYTGQELIGTEFSSYFSQPDKAQRAHQQVFQDGIIQNIELELCHRNRSVIQALYNFAVYRNEAGEVVGVFAAARDITERKRDEEALRVALEAAEVASRAKSLFIGNMSHELRTPLSGVLGMTEALLNTNVTDQQRDYAETIRKSGKALLAVVGNILDFSKISAGNMVLKRSPFCVEAVIANVVNLFGPSLAEEKKIKLQTTIDPEIPALQGDAHRLTQVVSNLLGNAVKFTKTGEIRVEVTILRRTADELDLALGVKDTGIGMTEEELSRIFTGFTQGDTTTARRFGGTGLGLTISQNLIELMGGTLQVESVFGKGSLFTVLLTLPIAQGVVKSDLKSVPINPVTPTTSARSARPPGDLAELQPLLEELKKPLESCEPRPCKDILAVLLEKSWPEEQETLLAELNRLVKCYRLQDALELLNTNIFH